MCGRPGWEARPPGSQVISFALSADSVSLEGSLDSFAVCERAHTSVLSMCVCTHRCVRLCFLLGISPKASTSRATAPFSKRCFVRSQAWVSFCNLFLLPDKQRLEDCFGLAVAGQEVEMGNICLVFNVWRLRLALPSFYYIDDRQTQATEKKQIT